MMREHCFDAALVFPNSLRAGLEVWLAGIPRRVGYPGHSRAFLLNQVIKRPKPPSVPQEMRHQVHDYLWLASSIGAPHLEESEWRVQSRAHSVSDSGRALRIAVCPGAEFGGAKRWLPERFAETMQIVSRTQLVEWIVVGVAKDAPVAEVIVSSCAGLHVENLTGRTGLKELIALLKSCDALLTNDTGTMHLAALFGVPLIAVFGSTEPRLTGPIGENSIVVQHRVPCGPCFQRECHLDFACMRGVDSAAVAKQMFCLLEQNPLTKKGSLPNPG
jgi:lipopolysaccharide heptosyltransferase II